MWALSWRAVAWVCLEGGTLALMPLRMQRSWLVVLVLAEWTARCSGSAAWRRDRRRPFDARRSAFHSVVLFRALLDSRLHSRQNSMLVMRSQTWPWEQGRPVKYRGSPRSIATERGSTGPMALTLGMALVRQLSGAVGCHPAAHPNVSQNGRSTG